MKKLLAIAAVAMASMAVYAQESPVKEDNTPKKNDFTAAVTLEYNSYANIEAQSDLLSVYEAKAMTQNWTDKKLMVGLEFGWFMNQNWKLEFGGGLSFSNHPGYTAVEGSAIEGDYEPGEGSIPSYRAVADEQVFAYRVFLGTDRYFRVKSVKNLTWYMGIRANFSYAQDQKKYDEVTSMGKTVAETWNLGGSYQMGVDYFVLPSLFVGASIAPFTYSYNVTSYRPQDGLKPLKADSHYFGFLAAPTVKVGFKF